MVSILARINTQAVLRSISLDKQLRKMRRRQRSNVYLRDNTAPNPSERGWKTWEYLLHGFGDAGTRGGTQFGGCVPLTGVRAAQIVVPFKGTIKMRNNDTAFAPRALQAGCVGGHAFQSECSRDGFRWLKCEQRDTVEYFGFLDEVVLEEDKGISAPITQCTPKVGVRRQNGLFAWQVAWNQQHRPSYQSGDSVPTSWAHIIVPSVN